MSQIEERLQSMCNRIINDNPPTLNESQTLNGQVEVYINQCDHNEQYNAGMKLYKMLAIAQAKILDIILPQFNPDENPLKQIRLFIKLNEAFTKSVDKMYLCAYYLNTCVVNSESTQAKIPDLKQLGKLKFNLRFQAKFQSCLFPNIVQLLQQARTCYKDPTKRLEIIMPVIRFGEIITDLQANSTQNCGDTVEKDFKTSIILHFENTYKCYFEEWKNQYNIEEYLSKVQQELDINDSLIKFGDESIKLDINQLLYDKLLRNYKSVLLDSTKQQNFSTLIRSNDDMQVLKLIANLFGKLQDHYDELTKHFKDIIHKQGLELMNNKQLIGVDGDYSDIGFVNKLHQLYEQYTMLIANNFSNPSDFIMALNNAFEDFINIPIGQATICEYLVTYMNDILEDLKVKSKGKTDSKSKQQLDVNKLIQLFVFINQKDRFFKLYRHSLARRLLKYTRQLDVKKLRKQCQEEDKCIQLMENRCGTQELENLRSMIKDILQEPEECDVDKQFVPYITIISKQHWPSFDVYQQTHLHPKITEYQTKMKDMFKMKELLYIDDLSTVEIEYVNKHYQFQLSIPQARILMLFNYQNQYISADEIAKITQIPVGNVGKHCNLLMQHEILVGQQNSYKFNEDMKTNRRNSKQTQKVKQIDVLFPTIEIEQIELDTEKEAAIVEAQIVRIMKRSKQLKMHDLVLEVQTNLSKLTLTISQIKPLIEKLINYEYLERHVSEIDTLLYKS